MKKHIFIILLFQFAGAHICFSQENLAMILENLSVKGKTMVQTKIIKTDGSDYFELMKKKQNFYYPINNLTSIHINNYKNISAYLVVPSMILSQEEYLEWMDGDDDFVPRDRWKVVLLFDREKSLCYLIKYGLENKYFELEYPDKNNSITLTANLKEGVVAITRLDKAFKPLYGANIGVVVGKKEGETNCIYSFRYCINALKEKSLYKKQIITPTTNILELSLAELTNLFSENSESAYNINVETTSSDEWLFESSISGY